MLDPRQFRLLVVRPALEHLDPLVPYSLAAENLILGTALVESGLRSLHQVGGPAIGVYQVEPATHADVWENYLAYRIPLLGRVRELASQRFPGKDRDLELATNLSYATAVARLVYRRSPKTLPFEHDAMGLAALHETVFNTARGALGRTPQLEALPIWRKVIRGGDYAA